MISLSKLICSKRPKVDITPQHFLNEGIDYVIKSYMIKVFGRDEFEVNEFEYLTFNNGLLVNLVSGEKIKVKFTSDLISISSDEFNAVINIYKDSIESCLSRFNTKGSLVEEKYSITDSSFIVSNKVDNEEFTVRADSIGYVKSGLSSYDLSQVVPPVQYSGILGSVKAFFINHANVREDTLGPSVETYEELDNLLNKRFGLNKKRIRERVQG